MERWEIGFFLHPLPQLLSPLWAAVPIPGQCQCRAEIFALFQELPCAMNSPELACGALGACAAAWHSIPRAGMLWCGAWHCHAGSSPAVP